MPDGVEATSILYVENLQTTFIVLRSGHSAVCMIGIGNAVSLVRQTEAFVSQRGFPRWRGGKLWITSGLSLGCDVCNQRPCDLPGEAPSAKKPKQAFRSESVSALQMSECDGGCFQQVCL